MHLFSKFKHDLTLEFHLDRKDESVGSKLDAQFMVMRQVYFYIKKNLAWCSFNAACVSDRQWVPQGGGRDYSLELACLQGQPAKCKC